MIIWKSSEFQPKSQYCTQDVQAIIPTTFYPIMSKQCSQKSAKVNKHHSVSPQNICERIIDSPMEKETG